MKKLLNQITQSNETLIHLADIGDWDSLVTESNLRHQLIENYFRQDETVSTAEELEQLAQMVAVTDTKISIEIKNVKNASIQSGLDLKKAQTALNQYTTTRNTPHTD